jgi:O-antigen/teichoic acid export membrane protein
VSSMRSQYAWMLFSRLLAAALQAGALALLAAWSGPERFGVTAAVLGIATILAAAGDLGIGKFVTRARAIDKTDGRVTDGLALNARLSLALMLLSAVGLLAVGTTNATVMATLPLAVWIASEKNADTWLGVAVADGRVHINAISMVVRRGLALVIFVLLVAIQVDAVWAFTTGSAIAALIGAGVTRRAIRATLPPPAGSNRRQMLRLSFHFWINTLATQARNLDVTVVTIFGSALVSGIYAVPARLTSPLRILPTSFAAIILPHAARAKRSELKSMVLALTAILGVMAFILAFIFVFARPLIGLLGDGYLPAVPALRILCVGLIFASAASFFVSILQGRGEARYAARTAITSTIVCLVGVALGAQLDGATGAAVGLSASFMVQVIILLPKVVSVFRFPDSEGDTH